MTTQFKTGRPALANSTPNPTPALTRRSLIKGLSALPVLMSIPALARSATPKPAETAGSMQSSSHFLDQPDVQAFMQRMVASHGFEASALERSFGAATFLPKAIELLRPARPGFVRSWVSYRKRYIEPIRLRYGVEFWKANADTLAKTEQKFGVEAEYIVAILGVETLYGRNTGNFEAFSTLATLGFNYPPRAPLFLGELEALLLLAREQCRAPEHYVGSFAGALGVPQFLPSSWRNFAVDADGDNVADLQSSIPDVLASVANFFVKHGWQYGQPVCAPVSFTNSASPEAVQALLDLGIEPTLNAQKLREAGAQIPEAATPHPAALIDLTSPDAPTEYRLGYPNFYTITRYNRSSFYASSVHDFAQEMRQRLGISRS